MPKKSDPQQYSAFPVLRSLSRSKGIIVSTLMISAALAAITPYVFSKRYIGSANLILAPELVLNEGILMAIAPISLIAGEIVQEDKLSRTSDQLAHNTVVNLVNRSYVEIEVTDRDKETALRLANRVGAKIAARISEKLAEELKKTPQYQNKLAELQKSLEVLAGNAWYRKATANLDPSAKTALSEMAKLNSQVKLLELTAFGIFDQPKRILAPRPIVPFSIVNNSPLGVRSGDLSSAQNRAEFAWLAAEEFRNRIQTAETLLDWTITARTRSSVLFEESQTTVADHSPKRRVIFLMVLAAQLLVVLTFWGYRKIPDSLKEEFT